MWLKKSISSSLISALQTSVNPTLVRAQGASRAGMSAVPFANQVLQVRLGTFPKSDAFEGHVAAATPIRAVFKAERGNRVKELESVDEYGSRALSCH